LMEMMYAFAMTASRYRLEMQTDQDIPAEFVATTRPTQPLYLNLRHRK